LTDGQTNEFETKIIFSFTRNIKFGICLINSFLHVDWDDQWLKISIILNDGLKIEFNFNSINLIIFNFCFTK
jgi:hypothetical protein